MEFTKEELVYLQELMDGERRGWFNYYMETLTDPEMTGGDNAHQRYQLANTLRTKFYHAGGRDTLALAAGYHEQREDQGHDNK